MQPLVILGSARPDGETRRAIEIAFPNTENLVVLTDKRIGGYDYAHGNEGDDFHLVVKSMLAHDQIVFATPVYWYAMSGQMKIFFDRLSDLTENAKTDGRALASRKIWLIVTGTEEILPEGFEVPFRRTAEYFEMDFSGSAYLYTGTEQTLRAASEAALAQFGKSVHADL